MKKLTKAAAKKRLTVYEADWLIPLVKEIDARSSVPYERIEEGHIMMQARDGLFAVHDYLRRAAVELGEERQRAIDPRPELERRGWTFDAKTREATPPERK